MTDLTMAAARALRLMLAALDDNAISGIDTAAHVLMEIDSCAGCRCDLILLLVDMVINPISCSAHRAEWVTYLEAQLAEVLDALADTES